MVIMTTRNCREKEFSCISMAESRGWKGDLRNPSEWSIIRLPSSLSPLALRRFAAVSMNFQNLYDFAQSWLRHFLIHFLSENAKKIGGHHVGFQDGADQSSLDYTRIFAQVFSINSGWLEGNELLSVLKHLGKHYHCARNDLRALFALAIVLQVKIANTIFGCLWHNGHTWANLGQMYLYDFYKIFTKCLYGYIIWKNAKKTGGHHVG